MSDEVREVEIRIQANQAIRELGRVAVSMDNVGNLAGRSDADLRRIERRMDSWAASTRQANATIVAMKAALAASKAETSAAEQAATKMAKTMERSAAAHDKTKAALVTATAAIKTMRKENTQLRTENEALVQKIERLDNALAATRQEFDAYKASINAADKGLLRFGASATQTLTRLESLEQQMNAMNGKSLSMLNLPTALAGNSAAAFARNPNLNAISQMGTQQLAQISQAYEIQSRTLQQSVQRELMGRYSGMGADALEFSNALRYQLYDIVGLFGTVGVAATGLSVAFLSVGIAWEKNFANVERTSQTTGAAVEALRQDFLDLQSTVPVTSADLATIGTLGAQMGVSAGNLAKFTEVVAQFSATANISVDESATALSRLDELLPDVEGNYVRLASAILKTGVNAVATEQQIVRGTGQIASMGQIAGLTAPQIVSLASAMSSLGFSPELQRSVITSSFSKILAATTEVTAKTEKFGAVLGMTGKQFQEAWRADALQTYRDLLEKIASRGDAVSVLSDLGLASQRLTPNLLKLGQNVDVLDEALGDTQQGWREQTELSRQYGVIARTVAARIQVLGQAWEALMVSLNDSDSLIGPIVDGLTQMVRGLQDIASSPGLSSMVTLVSVIGLIAGVGAIGASALALVTAGYIAMVNATAGLNTTLALNNAATETNTGAKTRNAAATGATVTATTASTTATNANTTSMFANSAALQTGATRAVNYSSKLLGALPGILAFGGAITVAAVAAAGIIAVLGNIDNLSLDWDKMVNGIDTPAKTVRFNVKELKKSMAEIEQMREDGRNIDRSGDRAPGVRGGPKTNQAYLNELAREKALIKDLEEAILELPSTDEQFAAAADAADQMGVSLTVLLRKMPGVKSALGDGAVQAAEMRDEVEALETAMESWAGAMGTDLDGLKALIGGLKGGASTFFNIGDALNAAFDDDGENGEGLAWFSENLEKQLATYKTFTDDLGTLTQRGGINLATQFAQMGPASAEALAETLKLSPGDLAKLEENMALAAFYASDAFANAFAENNSILALVTQMTGGNFEAVGAVNSALQAGQASGVGIDPATLAALEKQYKFTIPIDMIPQVDKEALELERLVLSATVGTVEVPLGVTGPDGIPLTQTLTQWRIEEEGKVLLLDVDPNTEAGRAKVAAWRSTEQANPVTVRTQANVDAASATLRLWRQRNSILSVDVRPNFSNPSMGGGRNVYANVRKDGGLLDGTGTFRSLPAFATGGGYGQFSGPGTGTSDSILARVSNGEYIHTARAVRYYGKDFFDDLNRMRVPRYATGGMIGGAPATAGAGTVVNATVNQYYPTTQDPIKKLKEDAESVIAGIWA